MSKKRISNLIIFSTVALLFGKGVLHFTAATPYDNIGLTQEWVPGVLGAILIASAILLCIGSKRLRGTQVIALILSSLIIIWQSTALFIRSGFEFENLIEHSLQIGLPLFAVSLFSSKFALKLKENLNILKLLAALCFIGHGLYALGLHAQPGHFKEMVMNVTGLEVAHAEFALQVIGIVDIAVALLVFVPIFSKPALYYMVAWGLITALARVVCYTDLGGVQLASVNMWEMIYRFPHGLIPLSAIWIQVEIKKQNNPNNLYFKTKMAGQV